MKAARGRRPEYLPTSRPLRFLPVALLLLALWGAASTAHAQSDGLTARDAALAIRQDAFGQTVRVIEGVVVNEGPHAYADVTLQAEVFDAGGALVGEGFGFLTDACGAALLPGVAHQPGMRQRFEIQVEMYDPSAAPDRFDVIPSGVAVEPSPDEGSAIAGVDRIAHDEVALVEWVDSRSLRYGAGCARDLFSELDWWHYSLRTGASLPARHPHADEMTDAFFAALGLDEPELIANSAIAFALQGGRVLFQGEANRFTTAERDGAFRRVLWDDVYNRTLQGVYWLAGDRFLAYYYGAPGDPVLYFTGDAAGNRISVNPITSAPSQIVPGASPDGRRAVIAGEFGGERGYFLKALVNNSPPQLLFEAEPPGNPWPPPIFSVANGAPGEIAAEIIYLARPVDGQARLQCYDLARGGPHDLAPLPLDLATDERARWWLSPDGRQIALAATGLHGGLWLVDLARLGPCGPA